MKTPGFKLVEFTTISMVSELHVARLLKSLLQIWNNCDQQQPNCVDVSAGFL